MRNKVITSDVDAIVFCLGIIPRRLASRLSLAHAKPCTIWAINYALSQTHWPLTVLSISLWFHAPSQAINRLSALLVFFFFLLFCSSRCPALLCCRSLCFTLLYIISKLIFQLKIGLGFSSIRRHIYVSSTIVLHRGRRISPWRENQPIQNK